MPRFLPCHLFRAIPITSPAARTLMGIANSISRRARSDSLHPSYKQILFDHAAGDALAGIAGGVGDVVVLAGVDHNGGAVGLIDGNWVSLIERDGLFFDDEGQNSPLWGVDVSHFARRVSPRRF